MKQAKVIFSFFLPFISLSLFSQGGSIITRIPKSYATFQIGAIGSLDICYRTLENKQREPSLDNLIRSRNESEMVKFGFHAGISLCINASENFGMETGVIYSNRGYETKLMNYIYTVPEPGMPTQGRSIYNYNFIDVPLKANLYLGKGKVRFYGSIGIVTNILVSQNQTFVKKYDDGRTEYDVFTTNDHFEKVVFTGTVSAGIDVKFNKHVNLRVAPNFGHTFGRFRDAAVSEYLWTAGLSVNFYYGWY